MLRARGWASETISTLLLNYVAILLVQYVVFGPWRDPEGVNYPQTAAFSDAAILPAWPGSRVHAGLLLGLLAVAAFAFVIARTRWGLELRAVGGNVDAAHRLGLPITRYVVVLMIVGGGLAGLAGMAEVSAIQGRLRPSLSPGYGYTGFHQLDGGWSSGRHHRGGPRARRHHRRRRYLADDPGAARLGGEHPDGRAALRRLGPPAGAA